MKAVVSGYAGSQSLHFDCAREQQSDWSATKCSWRGLLYWSLENFYFGCFQIVLFNPFCEGMGIPSFARQRWCCEKWGLGCEAPCNLSFVKLLWKWNSYSRGAWGRWKTLRILETIRDLVTVRHHSHRESQFAMLLMKSMKSWSVVWNLTKPMASDVSR